MTPVRNQLAVLLGPPVRRDHRQSDEAFRHRRVVAVVTLVVGAVLLSLSLSREPGDPAFYVLTLALAATWVVGAVVSGPLHVGWVDGHGRRERPVLGPVLVALAAVAVFAVGGIAVAQVPPLHHLVDGVLDHARQGWLPLIVAVAVVNGIAEELFFRGAVYAAVTRHPVPVTTLAYTVATLATGNLMLGFAAVVLGAVVGLQRRASGGILAPILTHVTWSLSMLFALPVLFG
jgi:uncharacterized protein